MLYTDESNAILLAMCIEKANRVNFDFMLTYYWWQMNSMDCPQYHSPLGASSCNQFFQQWLIPNIQTASSPNGFIQVLNRINWVTALFSKISITYNIRTVVNQHEGWQGECVRSNTKKNHYLSLWLTGCKFTIIFFLSVNIVAIGTFYVTLI